jgi:hypothetical protein
MKGVLGTASLLLIEIRDVYGAPRTRGSNTPCVVPFDTVPESSLDVFSDPAMLSAARRLSELRGGPQIAALDTSCVRTGLKGQLGLFMEYTTLVETARRLDRFAQQFGVPKERLAEMLNQDWLPYITVVKLPEELRRVDERASQVEALDRRPSPNH